MSEKSRALETPKMNIIHKKGVSFRRTKKTCLHNSVIVDQDTRSVECEECGNIIDAFDYLVYWANQESYAYEVRVELHKEVDKLDRQLLNLKKQIERLKEKKKRLL